MHINNCDVIIAITIKAEIRSQIRSVHAIKTFTIFSNVESLISIRQKIFLSNRNFLFELIDTNLFIYAHVINLKTFFILIRNNSDQIIKTFKNFRLKTVMKFDYSNAYQADSKKLAKLVKRHSK